MTGRGPRAFASTCACGKRGWVRRKDAKAAAKEASKGNDRGARIDAYRCKLTDSGLHHIGHLPAVVVRGLASRDQIVVAPRPIPRRFNGEPLT